jgi:hypothetical protein
MINNIEKNVSSAAEYIGVAKVETKKAVRYQKAARRVRLFPRFPSLFKSNTTAVPNEPKPTAVK